MPTTRIDLTGRRFDKLTVLEFASSSNSVYWKCVCDCGIHVVRRGGDLLKRERSGNSQSCGCARARISECGLLRCGKCRAFKPESAFRRNKRSKTGFHGHCAECQDTWRRNNSILVRRLTKEWAQKNAEHCLAHARSYRRARSEKFAARESKRRADRLRATPGWADIKKISAIYAAAKHLGLTVDHVIPLKSDLVCGLHVENNLQLLSKSDNCSKNNRFIPGVQ